MADENGTNRTPRCASGCGATRIYLHSRCHIGSPTWAVFDRETHELTIECAECSKLIAELGAVDYVRRRELMAIAAALKWVDENGIPKPGFDPTSEILEEIGKGAS